MNYFFEQKKQKLLCNRTECLDFKPHLHEHFEVGYILRGVCNITVEDKMYALSAGDFFVVFPNQIHSYSNSENLEACMLIFAPSNVSEFRKIYSSYVPKVPVIHQNRDIDRLVNILFEDLSRPNEFYRGMLLAICSSAFEKMELKKNDKYNVETIKSVLIYIDEHFAEQIDINSAAAELHISRSHISHMFRGKLNTTFTKYLTMKRIDYACELLKNEDMTVTDAAMSSGFGSIRTFNRVFTEYKGISPRKFRNEKNE